MDGISAQEAEITELFSEIAEGYDAANDRISLGLHRLWKARLCREAVRGLGTDARVLDLCCGTGDVAIRLAKLKKAARVTGLDITPKMLEIAGHRASGMDNVRFIQGDAMSIPFPDKSFELVTAAFGLRNTPEPPTVLAQINRVLALNGRILVMESSVPENKLIRLGFRLYFTLVMPILGGGTRHRQAYRWLNSSTWSFPKKAAFMGSLREAGFEEVSCTPLLFGCAAIFSGRKKRGEYDEREI